MGRVLRRQERLLDELERAGGHAFDGRVESLLLDLGLRSAPARRAVRRSSPAASASWSRWPPASPASRRCCCWTSRRRTSTRSAAATSNGSSNGFDGAVVMVSHDRYLLDETVTMIAELDGGRITLWPGNYSAYALSRELAQQRQQEQWVTQQKEIARLEEAIRRFKQWFQQGENERHMKQARVKQRQIERMDKVERPVLERRKMGLRLRSERRGGQRVVELRGVDAVFGDDPVLLDVSLTVMRGERVGIIGPNGSGKSVLTRLITGELEPSSGERWIGPSIELGTLAQEQHPALGAATPLDAVRLQRPCTEGEAVHTLMRLPVQLRAGAPAGGEAVRRGANAARAAAADARRRELPGARRAHQPPRHRRRRGARVGPRELRRHGDLRLPRPLLPRPHRRPDHRGGGRRGPQQRGRLQLVVCPAPQGGVGVTPSPPRSDLGLTVEERRERARRRTQRERRVAAAGAGVVLLAAAAFAVGQLGGSDTAGGASSHDRSGTDPQQPDSPPQLPRGGRVLLPDYRVVALYGAPQDDQLGELGIGTPAQAAEKLLSQCQPYDRPHRPVMPAFELIATLVTADPGDDGRYRYRQSDEVIDRYLAAARRAKALLILDVQPGRARFMDEVRAYRRYLDQPDVGLALDPEWSMRPGQVPGSVIGSTDAAVVNQVSAYLAKLVADDNLPQKLLIVHQFTNGMISHKPTLAEAGRGRAGDQRGRLRRPRQQDLEVPPVRPRRIAVVQRLQAVLPRGSAPAARRAWCWRCGRAPTS